MKQNLKKWIFIIIEVNENDEDDDAMNVKDNGIIDDETDPA